MSPLTESIYFYFSNRGLASVSGLVKTLLVSEDTHRKLMIAKMEMGFKSVDDMLA
jgi:hypothetical protein